MSDDQTQRRLVELRKREGELKISLRRLEAKLGALQKSNGPADRLAEVEAQTDGVRDELQLVTDELEGVTLARAEQVAAIDELEQLVDSFASVTQQLPELAPLLSAMKLCIGALASARRLERSHETLQEPKDIVAALTQALGQLASTLSSRAQVNALVR